MSVGGYVHTTVGALRGQILRSPGTGVKMKDPRIPFPKNKAKYTGCKSKK